MKKDIREMIAIWIVIPKGVVDHKGKVLHRPIVAGEGIEKEIVPERLEDKERALDERICCGEITVVPDHLAGQSRQVNQEGETGQECNSTPVGGQSET
jgi:hypothetical protein